MCVSNVLVSLFHPYYGTIGMRASWCAVIKAHKTANSKIDVKACLLKHMVTKQSLLPRVNNIRREYLTPHA